MNTNDRDDAAPRRRTPASDPPATRAPAPPRARPRPIARTTRPVTSMLASDAGEQLAPAEPHELVVAEARQASSGSSAGPAEGDRLDDEAERRRGRRPTHVRHRLRRRAPCRRTRRECRRGAKNGRCQPPRKTAAIKRAGRDDLDVLREEEHRELHAGVLGEVAGHELALALGQVERDALRFGDGRREEQEERRAAARRCPRRSPPASAPSRRGGACRRS